MCTRMSHVNETFSEVKSLPDLGSVKGFCYELHKETELCIKPGK